ncbi:EF-hand domain-containing protein [Pseudoscourfieldia marina]
MRLCWHRTSCLDDGKDSGTNDVTRMYETISLPSYTWIAGVAQSAHDSGYRGAITSGTDDVEAAYRKVPTKQPEATVICYYEPATDAAVFRDTYGLPMGLKASVIQFNRPMALMTYFANAAMLCPATHYYDDVNIADTTEGKGTAQRTTDAVFKACGMGFKSAKHSGASTSQNFLGVHADVTPQGVTFSATPGRLEATLDIIAAIRARRTITVMDIQVLEGKTRFLLEATHGRLGRAPLSPLRAAISSGECRYTEALDISLRYLQELLPTLPPKAHVFVGNEGEARVVRIYADASTSYGVGGVLLVGELTWYFSLAVPELLHLRIEVLELLAAAAAYYTFAHLLPPDRVIVHFIDSQVAFAWVAKGYASQLHVADIVNQLHLDHLHRQVWFEWLDSDANIADIPSRGDPEDPALAGDYAILRELGATRITAKLPPIPPSYYAAADTP